MSEIDHASLVIMAAIAAAGDSKGNEAAWKGRINQAIPHVAAMMGEKSRQRRIAEEVLDAQVFVATYRGYEVEASSTRCVVQLQTQPSQRRPDGIEPIRSHRTDNAQGKHMMERLNDLKDGDDILVWKAMESTSADTKVRILVHFEKLPSRSQQEASPQAVASRKVDAPVEENRAAGGVGAPAARFNDLPAKIKAKVAQELREAGIKFPEPDARDVGLFNKIIMEVEQRESLT